MNYTEYDISISPLEPWREILIAVLGEGDFESFLETENGVKAYIQANLDNENNIRETIDSLQIPTVNIHRTIIEKQNWNQIWESGYKPVLVDNLCYIRTEFHESKPEIPYEIIIEPKMSFGTGHHETTHLMVEYILETEMNGKTVLDMGCGTSILGILTKMRNAAYVEGIDIDDWAIENSIENAARNGVEIHPKLGDASLLGERIFDVILANINKNILTNDIPVYVKSLNFANGVLILSGLMETDFEDIKNICKENGLRFESRKQRNEWIALKFIKTN
ncbi:MAG: 50S ribosomal protein L11 methyltransferase [Weeksellaceae bacterium]|jgi:ribosomal protein L11 methyltransferase